MKRCRLRAGAALRLWIGRQGIGVAGLLMALSAAVGPAAAAGAEWSPIECPEAERSLSERVHSTGVLDLFEAGAPGWKAQEGDQSARAALLPVQAGGRSALQVEFEFIGKERLEYVGLEKPVAIPGGSAGIAFRWQPGTAPLQPAMRVVDASGEVHQFWGEEEESDSGWRYVVCLFQGDTSWGGDGNHRLDPPLRLHSLVFDRPQHGYRGSGRFSLEGLTAVAAYEPVRVLQVDVEGKRFGNLYAPGERVSLRANAEGAQVQWRAEDYAGKVVGKGRAADGPASFSFEVPVPGYYAVAIEAVRDNRVVETRRFACAALPEPGTVPDDGFLGFTCHFGHKSYPLECMELMKRYGYRRFRDEIAWGAVEAERGRHALPDYAAEYLDRSRDLGMEPLIILDYANRLYDNGGFPNSPEAIAGFAAYCAALGRLTQGSVRDFEIWNEWVGGCGMGGRPGDHGPEAYGRLMKAAAAAARAARPDARLIGVGGEYGANCTATVQQMLRVGGTENLNGFSIHPYRYPRAPEPSDLVGDVTGIATGAAQAGKRLPVWITEIGWPTHQARGGSGERAQARYTVRTAALLQTSGDVEKVYFYDFKDDGRKREYNEHNFGVVLHQSLNCAPKPAAVALSVFARMTAGAKPVRLQQSGSLHAALYRKPDGTELAVMWSAAGPVATIVHGSRIQVLDTMGNPLRLTGSALTATEDPVYLLGSEIQIAPSPDDR